MFSLIIDKRFQIIFSRLKIDKKRLHSGWHIRERICRLVGAGAYSQDAVQLVDHRQKLRGRSGVLRIYCFAMITDGVVKQISTSPGSSIVSLQLGKLCSGKYGCDPVDVGLIQFNFPANGSA